MKRRLPTAVPQLPGDLLQLIFSIGEKGRETSVPVCSLRDRVRALAVCRAWRSSLDPKAWPVESLELGDGEGEDRPITDWVISTQPAVRSVDLVGFRSWEFGTLLSISPRTGLTELSLLSDSAPMLDLLAPVCRFFPGLKALSLDLTVPDSQAELDLAVLQPLTRLQRLRCSEWPDVTLKSTAVLLQLTQLAFIEVAVIRIDAALPSLKLLAVDAADTFVLSGDPGAAEQLDLPQLSDFRLADIGSAAIGLEAAPQLARFDAREFGELAVSGMAELRHLTSLVLHCRWGSIDHALEVAPPTLLHLEVVGIGHDCSQPPPFHHVPRLTSLACDKLTIIPYLDSLPDLRDLDFPMCSASDLTLAHMGWLAKLTSLRRLRFGIAVKESCAGRRRLKALRKVLPGDCVLE